MYTEEQTLVMVLTCCYLSVFFTLAILNLSMNSKLNFFDFFLTMVLCTFWPITVVGMIIRNIRRGNTSENI